MNTSAINQREIIRNEIRSYDEKKYINKCLGSFSKEKTRIIRSNSRNPKQPLKNTSLSFDTKFIKKFIISIVLAFCFIIGSLSIKAGLLTKQYEYNALVSQTKVINAENQINESKLASFVSGPLFYERIEELGMIKCEKKTYINSDKFKEQYGKNIQNKDPD